MNVVREFLFYIERTSNNRTRFISEHPSYSDRREEIDFHFRLITQAGFVKAATNSDGTTFRELSWDGCEFLDAIREESVWERCQAAISKHGGGMTLEILKSLGVAYTKERLGLP